MVRGDELSAATSELGFEVSIEEITGDTMYFKLHFENPTRVSIGSVQDVLVATIEDEEFFCSNDSPQAIPEGTTIETKLPQLLPGENYEAAMNVAQSSIEGTTQTMMAGQVIITIFLSVSLKQLWNLFNVLQLLSILKNFTKWPALVQEVIKFITEAVYLKNVTYTIMDYGRSKFEIAKDNTKDSFLFDQGIEDSSLVKSLGIFAISLIFIAALFFIYFIFKKCASYCGGLCAKLKTLIYKKLFYSGPIRYVIIGYIRLFN